MTERNAVEMSCVERLEWIEPEIRQLDVRETAFRPHLGADGETHYADCTRS